MTVYSVECYDVFFAVQCLISKGDYDTAIALLKRAQNLDPDNKVIIPLHLL